MANPRFYVWCDYELKRDGLPAWEIRDTEPERKTHRKMPRRMTERTATRLCARMNADWLAYWTRETAKAREWSKLVRQSTPERFWDER